MKGIPQWLNHLLLVMALVIFTMLSSKTADQLWPAHSMKIDAVLTLLASVLTALGYRGAYLATPPEKQDDAGDGK